jgi:hypothetical protein
MEKCSMIEIRDCPLFSGRADAITGAEYVIDGSIIGTV